MDKKNVQPTAFNVKDFFTVIFKHKYKILITFVVFAMLGILVNKILPTNYEAKARLMVKFGREFVYRSEVGSDPNARIPISADAIINSQIQILTSGTLLGKVVESIGLRVIHPDIEEIARLNGVTPLQMAVRLITDRLSVKPVTRSSLIDLVFTHPKPVVANQVMDGIVRLYKDEHVRVYGGTSSPFLEKQAKNFADSLTESESEFGNFKAQHGIYSLEQQKTLLLAQRGEFGTLFINEQTRIKELEQKLSSIRSPNWTADTPAEIRTHLLTLQQTEQQFLQKYNENSRQVQTLRQEIAAVKDGLHRTLEDTRRVEIGKVQAELQIARTKSEELRKVLGQLENQIRTLDSKGKEFEALQRDTTLRREQYKTYFTKLEESRLLDEMDQEKMVNVVLVDVTPASRQVNKMQTIVVPLGFIGGIIGGILLAFLLEFLSHTGITPAVAEQRLGLPVIVTIALKK